MSKHNPTVASSPLDIAVLGVGGIGSAFAFQLARAGHAVTAIARPGSPRLQQMQRDGGIVDVQGARAAVRVSDSLDDRVAHDIVVVTLQAHRIDTLLPALQRSAAKCILFMFNNFDPERLRDAVGAERACFGMPFLQASIDPGGQLASTIGAGGQRSKLSRQALVDVFDAAGLPAVLEADMLLWLRCHVPLCVAFESVSVAGVRRGRGASWREAAMIARGVHASFGLIRRLGYRLYPSGKARLAGSPEWVLAALLWAVSRLRSFRELLATGIDECRALVDVLAACAARAGVEEAALARIRAMKPTQASGHRRSGEE